MNKNPNEQVSKGKKIFVPNQKTIEAMQAARNGDLTTIKNIDNLIVELNKK